MSVRTLKRQVLELLEETNFPTCTTRGNVSTKPCKAFALGTVAYRGQKSLGGKMKGPSRYNKKFPELLKAIRKLIRTAKPDFDYTTIQVNKNVKCKPHFDKNNVGPSYIIALGDFEGGELVVEGKEYNIHNRFKKFDGTKGHWVKPFKGERYSLVFFTHTFKPPSASVRGGLRLRKRGCIKMVNYCVNIRFIV